MKQEAIDALMGALSAALIAAAENHIKLIALEKAIEKQNPALYASYKEETERLAMQRAHEQNLSILDNVRAKLRQDQDR
jgi:ABC-type xylose transport system substrate-binding protein